MQKFISCYTIYYKPKFTCFGDTNTIYAVYMNTRVVFFCVFVCFDGWCYQGSHDRKI